ncbi:uncharacterized protein [Littorina saxatilis]|uniref:uncharacterized protein isoform X2 n=1 Tax=Littorina saxatilis TaxID=31220 RepID=UPI0038B5DD22
MASGSDENTADTCVVCLETYHDPKFLPCHHTFCAKCITDLAKRHTRGRFPCPSCRKPTSLPDGGVTALQANFYLKKQSEKKQKKKKQPDKNKEMCKLHSEKELEFYCVMCQEAICINCKMTKHEQHQTEDLHTAIQQKREEILTENARLQKKEEDLRERLKITRAEQKAVLAKKASVEKNIRDRHAVVMAAADKFRDKALDSLRSVSTDIDSGIVKVLNQQENDLKKLLRIKRQVERAWNYGRASDVMSVVQELKTGRGSKQALAKLTSQELTTVYCPVLDFKVTGDIMLQTTHDFMGTVIKMEVEVAEPEVRVVKRFPCGQEADIEVFSLCHVDSNQPGVCVSYERRGLKGDALGTKFSEDGEYIRGSDLVGKVSRRRYAKGKLMSKSTQVGSFSSHNKSRTTAHFRLSNNLSGKADVVNVKVTSSNPLTVEKETEFSINVGAHRAFDVDETGQFFVVVEEPTFPEMWRKVKLYQRPGGDPVSTYTPPAHLSCFQPSDVCFYKLNGEQVLLVTDELNDCIHVVYFQSGQRSKVHFLAQGCPWLIQPTAITVDVFARLWLACRGGTILCMEPFDM